MTSCEIIPTVTRGCGSALVITDRIGARLWEDQSVPTKRGPSKKLGLGSIVGPDGQPALVDQAFIDWTQSREPGPTQESLDALWHQADRVRLVDGGVLNSEPLGDELLLDVRERGVIDELRGLLRIHEGGDSHCMCPGDPAIELIGPRKDRVAVLGLHHGVAVRWDGWSADASLVDGTALLYWLDKHGVPGPLRAHQADEERRRQAQEVEHEWLEAVPAAVRHLGPAFIEVPRNGAGDAALAAEAASAFEDALADQLERAASSFGGSALGLGGAAGTRHMRASQSASFSPSIRRHFLPQLTGMTRTRSSRARCATSRAGTFESRRAISR